jgi:hypothetical protein
MKGYEVVHSHITVQISTLYLVIGSVFSFAMVNAALELKEAYRRRAQRQNFEQY